MITLELFLDNAVKSWQFALDIAWDQHRRHPELSRGKCLMERSFLRTLLGTDQAPVFFPQNGRIISLILRLIKSARHLAFRGNSSTVTDF